MMKTMEEILRCFEGLYSCLSLLRLIPCPLPNYFLCVLFSILCVRCVLQQLHSYEGLGILLLDYLASDKVDGFVDEADIANELRLSSKFIRKALRYLEGEHFLVSESVKFAFKRANVEEPDDPDVEVKKRQETHVFWAIDYPRVLDIVRLRIRGITQLLKKNTGASESVVNYECPMCGAAFTSLQAASLIDPLEGIFKCEDCRSELVEKTGEDIAGLNQSSVISRRERHDFFKELLQRFEKETHPILDQIEALYGVDPPDPGSLKDWYQTKKNEAVKRAQRLEEARKKFSSSGAAGAHDMTEEQLLEWAERAEVVIALPGEHKNSETMEEEAKEMPAWFKQDTSVISDGAMYDAQDDATQNDAQHMARKRQLEMEYLRQYLRQVQEIDNEDSKEIQATTDSKVIVQAEDAGQPEPKRVKVEETQVPVKAEQEQEAEPNDDAFEWEDA